ncbi:MAG: hypothetical protein KA248_10105 [Kiritimatiellae bacterium]|nr:hypothetical protein [Kiritimatiellia bacterium]
MNTGVAEQPALPLRRPSLPVAPPAVRRRGGGAWAAALLLAAAWHAAWIVGLGWRKETPRPAMPSAPNLLFAKLPAGPEVYADPRLVWSPVLFALPSPWGFSRPALEERIVHRPAAGRQGSVPRLREREQMPPPAGLYRDGQLEDEVAANLFRVPLPPLGASVFRRPARPPPAVVEYGPGWSEELLEDGPLPEGWEEGGKAPWEVAAYVEADAAGRVTHVLLEAPSAFPEVNRVLEGALRQWRWKPGEGARSGRVVFRAPGAPPDAKETP